MILLGAARGVGGVLLLYRGSALDPAIRASDAAASAVGAGLAFLGAALVVAGVGILRGSALSLRLGALFTLLFAVDGAVNGYVLYGRPGEGGTVVNVVVALLILASLSHGRRE
jgi:hypothetical protein